MSEPVVVEDRKSHFAVTVHFDCAPSAMGANLAKILPMIFEYALANGGEVSGPPFLRYHAKMEGRFFLEAGIPVTAAVDGNTEFDATELPGGKVAIGTHIGPYSELGATHREIRDWIRDSDWAPTGPCWDSYIDDPAEVEPTSLRTQIIYPVEKA